jgi:hypothetical protein
MDIFDFKLYYLSQCGSFYVRVPLFYLPDTKTQGVKICWNILTVLYCMISYIKQILYYFLFTMCHLSEINFVGKCIFLLYTNSMALKWVVCIYDKDIFFCS